MELFHYFIGQALTSSICSSNLLTADRADCKGKYGHKFCFDGLGNLGIDAWFVRVYSQFSKNLMPEDAENHTFARQLCPTERL
jgi:hypothetical protein